MKTKIAYEGQKNKGKKDYSNNEYKSKKKEENKSNETKYKKKTEDATEKASENNFSTRIVVKDLPAFLTQTDLEEHFNAFIQSTDVFMLKTKKGKFRRVAFVGYKTNEDAKKALEYFNNSLIKNHKMQVHLSEEKEENTENISRRILYSRKYFITNLKDIKMEDIQNDVAEYLIDKHKKLIKYHVCEEERGIKIEFDKQEDALDFYKNKKVICGRRIKIVTYDEDANKKQVDHFNTLFFDFNAVANTMAELNNKNKEDFVKVEDDSLGVKMALLEANLVEKTKKFLENNRIYLDKLIGLNKKKLIVRCEDILGAIEYVKKENIKIEVAPSRTMAIIEFGEEKDCERVQKQINYKRHKNGIIYAEYAPQCEEVVKKETNDKKETIDKKDKLKVKANCICIKNLPFQATKDDLKELFSAFCKVVDVRIPQKEDGTSRGFGFAVFENNAAVDKIIEIFGTSVHLYGRKLVIQRAQK